MPLAVRAVEVGHHVVGYDVDTRRTKCLNAGESFVEDVSNEALGIALASGRYEVASDPSACAAFDVAVITVPTPLRDGAPALSYVKTASETLARFIRPGVTVVLESTTYPGTTEEFVAPLLETRLWSGGGD